MEKIAKKIKVAINKKNVNKVDQNEKAQFRTLNAEFNNLELTIDELAEQINLGHPFCAQHLDWRNGANFICSEVLAVDIDQGMLLSEALANPFIQNHAAIVYTTPSHTNEFNRFRIVFVLESPITKPQDMCFAHRGVIRKFGGDEVCRDACRVFYGSKSSNPIVLGNKLSQEHLQHFIELGKEPLPTSDKQTPNVSGKRMGTAQRSKIALDINALVRLANGTEMRIKDVPLRTPIHCPVHVDLNPSAYVLESKTKIKGVHCSKCAVTYWPDDIRKFDKNPYDFYVIEDIIAEHEAEEKSSRSMIYQDPGQFDLEATPPGLLAMPNDQSKNDQRSSYTITERYLPSTSLTDGVTFVRSPKGSGKTEWLVNIVNECRQQSKSVLLIGHRRALLQSMSERLGLTCYYYSQNGKDQYRQATKYFAVSVDSISKLLEPSVNRYEVVIIDESEQVFSHLTSNTLKENRRPCYQRLFHYLDAAKSTLLADADLGPISIDGMRQAVGADEKYTFYANVYSGKPKDFECYSSEAHLWQELIAAVSAGKRCYVATNSITKAKQLKQAILLQVPSISRDVNAKINRNTDVLQFDERDNNGETTSFFEKDRTSPPRVMLITSEVSTSDDVQHFIRNIKNEILNYDVVVASPSLGTGVDISFPNGAQRVDIVFGFFMSRVNTHFDIDQQISRVRNPGAIKVWVSPEKFRFETEPEVIRREAMKNGDLNDSLINYVRETGQEILDERYVSVYSHVIGISRASKNDLLGNLLELRSRNGWNVKRVKSDGVDISTGIETQRGARQFVEQNRIDSICNAKKIDFEEYKDLTANNYTPNESERYQIERYKIEQFYAEKISPGLVLLDEKGTYRRKINLFAIYLSSKERLIELDNYQDERDGIVTDAQKRTLKQSVLRSLLMAAGIVDALNTFHFDIIRPEALEKFIVVCEKHALQIQDLFGITLRKDLSKKPILQLGYVLELLGLNFAEVKAKTSNGKKTRFYSVDRRSLEQAEKYAIRRLKKNNS